MLFRCISGALYVGGVYLCFVDGVLNSVCAVFLFSACILILLVDD